MQRRRDYKSLDEMANCEGVERVLEFLSNSPTCISNIDGSYMVYRHTDMKVLPYIVRKSPTYYKQPNDQPNSQQNKQLNFSTELPFREA